MKAIYYVFNVRTVHSEDTNYVRFLMSDTDLPRSVCEVSPAELADGKKWTQQCKQHVDCENDNDVEINKRTIIIKIRMKLLLNRQVNCNSLSE